MGKQLWKREKGGLLHGDPLLVPGGRVRLNFWPRIIRGEIGESTFKGVGKEYSDAQGKVMILDQLVEAKVNARWACHLEEDEGATLPMCSSQFFDPVDKPYLHVGGRVIIHPSEKRWNDPTGEMWRNKGLNYWRDLEGLSGVLKSKYYWSTDDNRVRVWLVTPDILPDKALTFYDSWLEPVADKPKTCQCKLLVGPCHCGLARKELAAFMEAQGKRWCRWERAWVKKKR